MQEGTGASVPPGLDPRGTRREVGENRQTRLTRRAFVRGTALGGAVALVAACAPAESRPPGGAPASGGAAAAPGSGVATGGAAPPAAASPRQVDYGLISPTALYWTAFVM